LLFAEGKLSLAIFGKAIIVNVKGHKVMTFWFMVKNAKRIKEMTTTRKWYLYMLRVEIEFVLIYNIGQN